MRNLIIITNFKKKSDVIDCQLFKICTSSILRSFCECDILLIHQSEHPVFLVERKGVFEWAGDPLDGGDDSNSSRVNFPFRSLSKIIKDSGLCVTSYERIALMNPSCLCQRNVSHLFDTKCDIQWLPVRGVPIKKDFFDLCLGNMPDDQLNRYGSSISLLSIKSDCFTEVMNHWNKIVSFHRTLIESESLLLFQSAWNKLLINTKLKTEAFERGEIKFPLWIDSQFSSYRDAAIICGDRGEKREVLSLNFGRYMDMFFRDEQGMFLNFLEL